jgi:hypothetical protein
MSTWGGQPGFAPGFPAGRRLTDMFSLTAHIIPLWMSNQKTLRHVLRLGLPEAQILISASVKW